MGPPQRYCMPSYDRPPSVSCCALHEHALRTYPNTKRARACVLPARALPRAEGLLTSGQRLRRRKQVAALLEELLAVPVGGAIEDVLHLLDERVALRGQRLDLLLRRQVGRVVRRDPVRRSDDQPVGERAVRRVELFVDITELDERRAVATLRDLRC